MGFKNLYGISNNKYYKALELGKNPEAVVVHQNVNNQHASKPTARNNMHAWITTFVEGCGDHHPTENVIYIPRYIPQSSLYDMYKNEWMEKRLNIQEIPSKSSFINTFDKYFPHVKFLKQTVLGRCDFCMSIPDQMKAITNEEQKLAFTKATTMHRELHTRERMSYAGRTQTSQINPSKILHLVFDCPDSYDIPHIVPVTKESANLEKLSTNAVGTINHSAQTQDYMFFLDNYKKNPNLILTCFYLHIVQHFQTVGHPPILWLQTDNCFKENKNRWMLGFCFWLVELGWFQEVMISMLPPGHTHVDIDQMFSTLSIYLKHSRVEIPTEMPAKVEQAYRKESTKPTSSFLPCVFNFVGFLAPFVKAISGLNSAHVFLIRKLPTGNVGMKIKKWHSTSEPWMGSITSPDNWIELLSSKPPGFPAIVPPIQIEEMPSIDVIKKYNRWLSESNFEKWKAIVEHHDVETQYKMILPENLWNYSEVKFLFLC